MQNFLTYLIEIITLSFTAIMVFDFLDGLFPMPPMPKLTLVAGGDAPVFNSKYKGFN